MPGAKETLKEILQKKSLPEVEAMITEQKRKIAGERNLTSLHRLTTELNTMQEILGQKQSENSRKLRANTKAQGKPELKSFDDYVKSKK